MSERGIDKTGNKAYNAARIARWRMKDIHKMLGQKRKELERLQREVDALSIAAGLLSGEEPETEGREQSQPQLAVAILEASGKPLHVSKIAEQMAKQLRKKVKKTNLGVLLFRYAQRGKHFYKVTGKPNTYGLLKWRPVSGQQGESKAVQ